LGPLHAVGCRDSKMLLAYSSVSHINLGVYGLGVISSSAYTGNILLGVRHGYVSALMFYVVGTCYIHTGTRQLYFLLGRLGGSSVITVCSRRLWWETVGSHHSCHSGLSCGYC